MYQGRIDKPRLYGAYAPVLIEGDLDWAGIVDLIPYTFENKQYNNLERKGGFDYRSGKISAVVNL